MTASRPTIAHLAAQRAAHREAHPLAYARLWRAEGWDTSGLNGSPQRARTSQRREVGRISGNVSFAVFGGNGTGKSEVLGQLSVACMLGRGHPDVQAWLRNNGLPADLVPPYPGRVLASALTFAYSRKVVRAKVAKYLPRDAAVEWRNRYGEGEAEVAIPSLRPEGDQNGASIVFKSNDQGADGYQSDEFDVVLNDEEHDQPVFEQELARLTRREVPGVPKWLGGYVAHFATLENGATWLYDTHQANPQAGYAYGELHAPDSPYVDLATKLRQYAGLSAAKRATRLFGTPGSAEGLVYGEFSRAVHVIPARPLPAEWTRFRSIDFGTRNPFACLWFAVDPADTTIHVYRALYRAGYSTKENGAEIVKLSKGERYAFDVADPESLDGRRTLAMEHGIVTQAANKAIIEGISDVTDYLTPDADGKVHLVFHDTPDMQPVLREIGRYRYPDPTGKKDGLEAPVKHDDHAMDALRYGVRYYKLTHERLRRTA